MSGSLNIVSPGTQWKATTATNCPLSVSQTSMTVAGFVDVASYIQAVQNVTFFSGTGFRARININVGWIDLALFGANINYVGTYIWPALAQRIHFAATLNATGTSRMYFNGLQISTASNVGATGAAANPVTVGWLGAFIANFAIGDFAVWNGVELSAADIIRHRDRIATAAELGATSSWSLGGPAGNHPIASADGMLDQIGSNHFITLPGVGNDNTIATYSATTLNFIPPVAVVEAQITRSGGSVVEMMIGTNPDLGTPTAAYPIAVTGAPAFTLNGTPALAMPADWSSTAFSLPCIAYRLYTAGTPPQPVIFSPSDVLTWTTPANWFQTSQGFPAAQSGTAGNYVGRYEPVYFGYSSFDPAENPPTMGLGFNNTPFVSGSSMVIKDVTHRTANPWPGSATSTVSGEPLTFTSGGVIQGANFWNAGDVNGIDAKGIPCPTGIATFVGDEWLPASPVVVTMISTPSQPTAINGGNPPTITPGTVDGSGHEIGKKWEWNISLATGSTYNLKLSPILTAPLPHTNGQELTLKNIRGYTGGDIPETSQGVTTSENFLRMITGAPGVYSPYCRYLMDNDGANSMVRSADLPPADDFSYSNLSAPFGWWTTTPDLRTDRIIPVYAVQAYSVEPGATPNFYVAQNYARSVPTDGYSDRMYVIKDLGLDYDWMFPQFRDGHVILQFVCADSSGVPVNHNLEYGQFITFNEVFTVNVVNDGDMSGTKTVSISGSSMTQVVFPTSATTFLGLFYSTTLPTGYRMGRAASFQVVNKTATFRVTGAGMMPIEALTGPCRATNGQHGLSISVNHALNDEGITAFATRIFNSTPRGTTILVQWSNEIAIPNAQNGWVQTLAVLEGFYQADPTTSLMRAITKRTRECHAIFESVWGSDAGSLIRPIQIFTALPTQTFQAFSYAQEQSWSFNGYLISAYYETGVTSPTRKLAAAAMIADNPDSCVYSGGQVVPKLPRSGYNDLLRFDYKYDKMFNGPTALFNQHHTQLLLSGYGAGGGTSHYVHALPDAYGYECGICTLIPAAVSTTSIIPRSGLTHDLTYDPSMHEVAFAYWQCCQQPGATGTPGFKSISHVNLTQGRTFGGTYYTVVGGSHPGADNGFTQPWGQFIFQTQAAGYGLTNLYWMTDGVAHDATNQAVMGQAGLDWIAGTTAPPPSPASFVVSPMKIAPNHNTPITLELFGVNTTWSGSSVVSVTNSVTGTTAVTAGTFTAISGREATLSVTTGAGAGTWRLTIDGVPSDAQTVASSVRRWFSQVARPALH